MDAGLHWHDGEAPVGESILPPFGIPVRGPASRAIPRLSLIFCGSGLSLSEEIRPMGGTVSLFFFVICVSS